MNKLQPYFKLGETLGSFAAQITQNAVQEIRIDYAGDLSEVDTSPLTRYIVKGILARHLGGEANIVNSMHLAKIRDLNVVVSQTSATKGFTNLITVTLVTTQDAEEAAWQVHFLQDMASGSFVWINSL